MIKQWSMKYENHMLHDVLNEQSNKSNNKEGECFQLSIEKNIEDI